MRCHEIRKEFALFRIVGVAGFPGADDHQRQGSCALRDGLKPAFHPVDGIAVQIRPGCLQGRRNLGKIMHARQISKADGCAPFLCVLCHCVQQCLDDCGVLRCRMHSGHPGIRCDHCAAPCSVRSVPECEVHVEQGSLHEYHGQDRRGHDSAGQARPGLSAGTPLPRKKHHRIAAKQPQGHRRGHKQTVQHREGVVIRAQRQNQHQQQA